MNSEINVLKTNAKLGKQITKKQIFESFAIGRTK